MDEMQAAVLRARLTRLDESNRIRRSIMASYVAAAPSRVGAFFEDSAACVAHLAVLVFASESRAGRCARRARSSRNRHGHSLPGSGPPAARHGGLLHWSRVAVTDRLASRVLTVPCFPELTADEVGRVCRALSSLATEV